MAKRSKSYKHPGMADKPLVQDIFDIATSDGDLYRRHTDLVIKAACKRMKKGTFDAGKFCNVQIKKYTVPNAVNSYFHEPLFSRTIAKHGIDKATQNVLAAKLCKEFMAEAKDRARSGKCD